MARGQRIRDRAGRPRRLSEPRCSARPGCSPCAKPTTARAARLRREQRPGRWSIISSRTCSSTAVRRKSPASSELFTGREGIDEVLAGDELAKYDLNHERSGEVVLVSTPTVGRPITGGSTTPERRNSPARSISIASRATTRSNCISTSPRRAFRSTPRSSRARTALRPATSGSTA